MVELWGEADFSTSPILSYLLAGLIASGVGDVVIDLAQLEFIDTASVRSLAAAQQTLVRLGRQSTSRSPARVATRVLNMFGLADLIETHEKIGP